MTNTFIVCNGCFRHVRASDASCPFCRSAREATAPSARVVAMVAGAALVGALSHDASAQNIPTRLHPEHAPAAGYGAPPVPPGLGLGERGPAARVEARVSVSVDRGGARYAPVIRMAMERRLDALRACRARIARPVTGVERASVQVPWGNVPMPPGPAMQRDVLSQCLANVVTATLPPAPPGRGGRVTVQVTYSPERPTERIPVRAGIGGTIDRCGSQGPVGCRHTGCPDGLVCDTRTTCVPSSCSCDPATGQRICTSDCGGGVCVPARRVDAAVPL